MHSGNIVVLLSGSGSNLQSIIDAWANSDAPGTIRAVISNRPAAFGLERARKAGIETRALDHKAFADRESFDTELLKVVNSFQPDLVVLAGFMRILTPAFVTEFYGRLLNIHPSLLPKYPGLHTHQRALDAGDTEHGASIHFVTEELDGGPVVLQVRVPVLNDDSPDTLAARVLVKEHQIYPLVCTWFMQGRLILAEGHATLDGNTLPRTGVDFADISVEASDRND